MRRINDWYDDYAFRHELTPGYSPDDDVPDPYVPGEVPAREWVVPRSAVKSSPVRPVRARRTADRGGSWEAAARKWLRSFPTGSNRECLRALAEAGHSGATTQSIGRLRANLPGVSPEPVTAKAARKTQTRGRPARAKSNTATKAGAPAKPNTAKSSTTTKASAPAKGQRTRKDSGRRSIVQDQRPWHVFVANWFRQHPKGSIKDCLAAVHRAGYVTTTAADVSVLHPANMRRKPARRPGLNPPTPLPVANYCPACGIAVGLDGNCRC
ncbi:hypothetical protein GCM10010171_47350 [Actinokineospora fastidiosa]|uniref:Uncharacterized protein n=2 Tax=Actinokineospora fastidiosa TaxID=1816 RepID=A0A918GMG2_9PSEU|nr:hypothetical protein GCM10010171_47350 [Actinokineospora fastidiosa]